MKDTTNMALNDIQCTSVQRGRLYAAAFGILVSLALALSVGLLTQVNAAYAEDIDTDPSPDQLQQEIERTAAELEAAQAKVEQINADIQDNSERLQDLEKEIPLQQQRSDAAARELYKTQQRSFGILEILLGSESLPDFLNNVEYVSQTTSSQVDEIVKLKAMQEDLAVTQEDLEKAHAQAETSQREAEQALAAAQEARAEAQRKAEEEARRQAEEAAAAAAAAAKAEEERLAAEKAAAKAKAADDEEADNEDTPEDNDAHESDDDQKDEASSAAAAAAVEASNAAALATADGANWNTDKDTFINDWAGRIDAYLAGSPLAGQGKTFAGAAWDNGIDPRWSPAISCVESGKGAVCFKPHNAWGWGSSSWDNWEDAIKDHVRGLARGYGYTVTREAAAKYCPPNASHWYARCVEEMNKI